MIDTFSLFFDSNHFIHPFRYQEAGKTGTPNLQRRITGVVLALLSLPLTFCMGTGAYLFWAYRKVIKMRKGNEIYINALVKKVFPKTDPKALIFKKVCNAVKSGDLEKLNSTLSDLSKYGLEMFGTITFPVVKLHHERSFLPIPKPIIDELKALADTYGTLEATQDMLEYYIYSNE